MTKTLSINEVQGPLAGLLALAKDGDEIIIELDGEPMATVSRVQNMEQKATRTAGLGKGTFWMSDDFDNELREERKNDSLRRRI